MQPFFKKESAPDFSKPEVQQEFVQDATDSKSLLQKELEVNQEEQNLLEKRIGLMKSFLNDLPSLDPQYSMVAVQLQMDQLELDELRTRETLLSQMLTDT